MSPEEVCHQNIYGFFHCFHGTSVERDPRTGGDREREAKIEFVLQLEVCCWCGKKSATKHGLHLPKEEKDESPG